MSQVLLGADYEAQLIVLPGATHSNWPTEARDVVVDTVLHAGDAARNGE